MSTMSASGHRGKVAVLMAVFEGERFLAEQLASIREQDHEGIGVWVSRDCSGAGVATILDEHADAFDRGLFVRQGPGRGSAANFLSMVCDPDIDADYFAFSDQDDIWEPDKLSRAIEKIARVPPSVPALYGSRTRLIDHHGHPLGLSPLWQRPPGFRNALVQNIIAGNTLVMNRCARDVLRSAGAVQPPFHDWWAYLLIAGVGGTVIYDAYPSVRYRLHDDNLTGLPISLRGRAHRIMRLMGGQLRQAIAENIRALIDAPVQLTPENGIVVDLYCEARRHALPSRLRSMRRSGVYRQTRAENMGLLAAAALNRL